MCIRDRGPGEPGGAEDEEHGCAEVDARGTATRRWYGSMGARGLAAHGREVRAGRYGACLLYTSDAADEGSSVDLGGRRIIKKKKTQR